MGVVFLGSRGSARVAVKVMRSSFLDSPALRTRFEREIETLKKIKSSFVARYLDSDVEGDLVWHAVEFVNGPTLKEKIENDGPLDEGDWWALYSQMREALNDVHKLGLVHRDLKPANIILSETGLKLIDFGIAQDSEATSLTSTGMVAGSPAWLSPEQLEGTEVGPGSDLFSAGSILTYAALGRSPWGKETTMTVPVAYKKILNRDFDLEDLPPSYQDAVAPLFHEEANKRAFVSDPTTHSEEIHRKLAVERDEHPEVPQPILDPEESGVDRVSPRILVPKRSRKLGLSALLISTLVVGGFLLFATATGPLPESETFDDGDFGLQIDSGDDPMWDGDDRLPWVDVRADTKPNLDVESVFIEFYDSAGRELFTTPEYGWNDQCNSSRGMILDELPSTAQWSFAGKCSIDEVLQPGSQFRVWITFPDGTQAVRLELVDQFLNSTAWLSDLGAN